jgi:hypothetical protein
MIGRGPRIGGHNVEAFRIDMSAAHFVARGFARRQLLPLPATQSGRKLATMVSLNIERFSGDATSCATIVIFTRGTEP